MTVRSTQQDAGALPLGKEELLDGLSQDAHDPRFRGAPARRLRPRRHPRLRASLRRRGSGRRRHHASPDRRRPHREHASRTRPLHREGRRSGRDDEGDLRQEGRLVQRQGRLDAYRRSVEGDDGRERHPRRGRAAHLRRGARREVPRQGRSRHHLRGRRRVEPGHVPRKPEPRGRVEPAGDLRDREQRLCGIDVARLRHGGGQLRRSRGGLRHSGRDGRRHRFLRGPRSGGRSDPARARRRRTGAARMQDDPLLRPLRRRCADLSRAGRTRRYPLEQGLPEEVRARA